MAMGSMNSIRAIGMPACMVIATQFTASSSVGNAQTPAATSSGWPCSRRVSSVMMPSVPSGPDHQRGQVIARAGFRGARSGADDAPVGQHHFQRQHVLAHRAIAHGGRAAGARRGHAAQRRIRAGIDGEHQPGRAQFGIQRLARDAGLHDGQHVARPHVQHLVHPRQVQRDAARARPARALPARCPPPSRSPGCGGRCRCAGPRTHRPWSAATPPRRAAGRGERSRIPACWSRSDWLVDSRVPSTSRSSVRAASEMGMAGSFLRSRRTLAPLRVCARRG